MSAQRHARVAVVACGALALHVQGIARRRGWDVDVHPLPPELHNRPERIAPAARELIAGLRDDYERVVLAYADCGSQGAIDDLGLERLEGDHCYDVFARSEVRDALREEPGTYFLTDFLARTFDRTVVRSLGLDRYPELRDEYFRHYRRVVWLAQRRTPELEAKAQGGRRPDRPPARGGRGGRGRPRARPRAPRGGGRRWLRP